MPESTHQPGDRAEDRGVEGPVAAADRPVRTSVGRVSIVAPMFNEAEHVEQLVADLAAQAYQGEVEILVADGGSTDGSPELLAAFAKRAGLPLTLLENPKRSAAAGLNACIRRSTGDLIVRLDCHSRYPADYVRRCVIAFEETGAWNVGGVFAPIGRTRMERAVACALDSPFGGHNWTRNLNRNDRVEVDTNYLGAFPREALERVGLYDEAVVIAEVEDLNLRLRRAGGRVILDPAIRPSYLPRGSSRELFRQYYRYGLWKVFVMLKHGQVVSGRSVVPLLFVLSLAALAATAVPFPIARWLLGAGGAAYAGAALAFAAASIRRRKESWSLLPRVATVFPTFHLAHGLGQVHGWVRAARRRLRPS